MISFRVLCLFLIFACSVQVQARPSIVFSCSLPDTFPQWHEAVEVFTEAFDVLGYDFSMVYLNSRREVAEHLSRDGLDGSCARVKSFPEASGLSKMVLVDEPIAASQASVWASKKRIPPEGQWVGFESGATVGYFRGVLHMEALLAKYPSIKPVSFLRPDMGLKTLAAGRIDYWAGLTYSASHVIKVFDLDDSVEKVATIGSISFYPFLNQRHRSLLKPLEQELSRIMMRRGSIIN